MTRRRWARRCIRPHPRRPSRRAAPTRRRRPHAMMSVSCAQLSPPYLDKLFRRALFFAKGTYLQDVVTMDQLTSLVDELRWVMSQPLAEHCAPELKVPS